MIFSKLYGQKGNIFLESLRLPVLGTLVALSLAGCVNDIEKIKAFNPTEILPVIHAENFETTFSDSGIVRFYLKTPELKRYETDESSFIEFPRGVLLKRYNQNREVVATISARYAKQFVKERRWEAKNDVVATNSIGDTLRTEHLIWNEETGRIYNDEFVKVIRPDQVITGIGFDADQNLSNWRIRRPRGPIYVRLNSQGQAPSDSVFGNLPVLRPVNISDQPKESK